MHSRQGCVFFSTLPSIIAQDYFAIKGILVAAAFTHWKAICFPYSTSSVRNLFCLLSSAVTWSTIWDVLSRESSGCLTFSTFFSTISSSMMEVVRYAIRNSSCLKSKSSDLFLSRYSLWYSEAAALPFCSSLVSIAKPLVCPIQARTCCDVCVNSHWKLQTR